MQLINNVTIGRRAIDLYTFTGEVLGEKKWSSTHVSGGGSSNVYSSTTTHNQFFLRDDAGREESFTAPSANLALRKGHRVTVLWGIAQGENGGLILGVRNHNTGHLTKLNESIEKLAWTPSPNFGKRLILYLVLSIVLAPLTAGFSLLLLPILYWRSKHQRNVQIASLELELQPLIAQIKAQA